MGRRDVHLGTERVVAIDEVDGRDAHASGARIDAFQKRQFLEPFAHDGGKPVKDTAAVTWAEKQCPSDPTLDLSSFDGDEVHIYLAGTCAGCPGSSLTTEAIILPALRSVVPKVRVVVTTGLRAPTGAERCT